MKPLLRFAFVTLLILAMFPVKPVRGQAETPAAAIVLDPTFSNDGKLLSGIDAVGYTYIAVQPDGKILVATTVDRTGLDFAVLRYLPNGNPDTGFSGDGRAFINFDGDEMLTALLLQPNGKIILVGKALVNGESGTALARLTASGQLDSIFSNDGKVFTMRGHEFSAGGAVLLPNGKIVVAGDTYIDLPGSSNNQGTFLARYTWNGNLDQGFGDDGIAYNLYKDESNDYWTNVREIVLLPDGRFVVRQSEANEDHSWWNLYRYRPDGSFEFLLFAPSEDQGCVLWSCQYSEGGLAVQPDGKLVLGGERAQLKGQFGDEHYWVFYLTRFLTNGEVDLGFGHAGNVETTVTEQSHPNDRGHDVALQSDGKIIVVGITNGVFAMARYNQNGNLDTSFGDSGFVINDLGSHNASWSTAIQSNGKIVVAAAVENGLRVARFSVDDAEPDPLVSIWLPFLLK